MINFRKFAGVSNKIATAGLPRAAEPWKFLRICQIDKIESHTNTAHTSLYFLKFFKKFECGGGGLEFYSPSPRPWKWKLHWTTTYFCLCCGYVCLSFCFCFVRWYPLIKKCNKKKRKEKSWYNWNVSES